MEIGAGVGGDVAETVFWLEPLDDVEVCWLEPLLWVFDEEVCWLEPLLWVFDEEVC